MSSRTIKNISYSNAEILNNIITLHNNGEPFQCDMTYSKGNFYGKFKVDEQDLEIHPPTFKFDVNPQLDCVSKIEPWGTLPLDDESISSIVIDLPFVIAKQTVPSMVNPKDGSNIIIKRFGSYYPYSELFKSYSHWLQEAWRVLKDDGICVWKCQNTITSSKFICSEEYSWMAAQKQGFYVLDKFILIAKNRLISSKVKKQQHARNYTSTFYVFKKGGKIKPINYE